MLLHIAVRAVSACSHPLSSPTPSSPVALYRLEPSAIPPRCTGLTYIQRRQAASVHCGQACLPSHGGSWAARATHIQQHLEVRRAAAALTVIIDDPAACKTPCRRPERSIPAALASVVLLPRPLQGLPHARRGSGLMAGLQSVPRCGYADDEVSEL